MSHYRSAGWRRSEPCRLVDEIQTNDALPDV
jgi:hypothetical protein